MKLLTHQYHNKEILKNYIQSNQIDKTKEVLVQIFSGIIDEEILLELSSFIKKEIPNAKVIGTTTAGEIYESKVVEQSIVISFSLFEKSIINSAFVSFEDETYDNFEDTIEKILCENTKLLIVFSDGLQSNGEDILRKLNSLRSNITIAGGRAGDNFAFTKTLVFDDKNISENGFVIASLSGEELYVHNNYMLDWDSVGEYMTVTKSAGNILYEIDGMSAVDVYKRYLGDDIADTLPQSGIEFPLIIKRNGMDVARAPIAVFPDNSLVFGGNIQEGEQVQFGFGSIERLKSKASENFKTYKHYPIEAMYIYSCSARVSFLGQNLEYELAMLRSLSSITGYFTYGEFLHNNEMVELLNITTTFVAISESKDVQLDKQLNIDNEKIDKTFNALLHLLHVTSQDLQKNKEAALKLSNQKTEFLANMSHEIRTPLNSILGFVDIIKEQGLTNESISYIDNIQESSIHLNEIVNDILDFSKIESGKLELEIVVFESEIFENLSKIFSSKAKEKNIDFEVLIDNNLPKFIETDLVRLKQVIVNLLSNAFKFCRHNGKIEYKVTFEQNKLFVSVQDNGIGIALEKLDSIFEAFSQEDNSTTRKYGGTGLGLSISYQIIKMLEGSISVESQKGEGSKFYFWIPVATPQMLAQRKDVQLSEIPKIDKILLVEDNKANQAFMKVFLKSFNISYDLANDGLEAIEMFKKNSYDFILMDENMPNMSGSEAVIHIRAMEEKKQIKRTPIIALTANAIQGDKQRFLDIGMDGYLTKPLDKRKFVEIIKKTLP